MTLGMMVSLKGRVAMWFSRRFSVEEHPPRGAAFMGIPGIGALCIVLAACCWSCAREQTPADRELARVQSELRAQRQSMIRELLLRMPHGRCRVASPARVGSPVVVYCFVDHIPENDSVTRRPEVHVYQDGEERTNLWPVEQNRQLAFNLGQRQYHAVWTPVFPGDHELWVEAGTNYIDSVSTPAGIELKIGPLRFPVEDVQQAIDADPVLRGTPIASFARRARSIDPVKITVHVSP
jgi:hypothetical protein